MTCKHCNESKRSAVEIRAAANGWIVTEPYRQGTYYTDSESVLVFDRMYALKAWLDENLMDNSDS